MCLQARLIRQQKIEFFVLLSIIINSFEESVEQPDGKISFEIRIDRTGSVGLMYSTATRKERRRSV
jgi:hypothetical protein